MQEESAEVNAQMAWQTKTEGRVPQMLVECTVPQTPLEYRAQRSQSTVRVNSLMPLKTQSELSYNSDVREEGCHRCARGAWPLLNERNMANATRKECGSRSTRGTRLPQCERCAAPSMREDSAVITSTPRGHGECPLRGGAPWTPIEWREERSHHCMRGVLPTPHERSVATVVLKEHGNRHARGECCHQCPEGVVDTD